MQGSSWLRNLGRSDFSLQTKREVLYDEGEVKTRLTYHLTESMILKDSRLALPHCLGNEQNNFYSRSVNSYF